MNNSTDISAAAQIYVDQHGYLSLPIVRQAAKRLRFLGDRSGADLWVKLERGILDLLDGRDQAA